jgi:hypothetical protein
MMRLTEFFLLVEDSRGNIKKFLKMSDQWADHFHAMSPKFSFAMAKCFVIWLKGEHVQGFGAGGGGQGGAAQVGTHNNDKIQKILTGPVDNNYAYKYDRELGGALKKMLEDKPHYEKELNRAQNIEDIRKVQGAYKKKRGIPEDKLLLKFPDDWYWMRLDPEECAEEGSLMQHCATDGRGDLVSLRDEHGNPHVTMTYNQASNRVFQIKGKQNKAPEKKYWDYILAFWDKFTPLMKDADLKRVGGGELTALLHAKAPEDKILMQKLAQLERLFEDEDVNKWLWDLTLLTNNAYGYEEGDLATIEQWFKKHGFEAIQLELVKDEKFRVLYNPKYWADAPTVRPKYEQLRSWTAWTAASFIHTSGKSNSEIAGDIPGWIAARATKLQEMYTGLHNILGIQQKKPISINAANKTRAEYPIEADDYADWFEDTRPKAVQEWSSKDEFFKAFPEVKAGVDAYVDRYAGYGGIREKYDQVLSAGAKFWKDSLNRYLFQTQDGSTIAIRPVGKKFYYLRRLDTGAEIFGQE